MSLISVEELAARLDEPELVICDVRFYLTDHDQGRGEYDTAHLPGARFVDLHTELAGGPGGGRHPLPTPDAFAGVLGRIGVSPDSFVVAYDSAGGAIASRLWWMLRSIGHARVAVLDGGYPAWVASGHPVGAELPSVTPTAYPTPSTWTGVVTADGLADELARGTTVIDARAAERFRGDHEPIDARAGHVPGAINRFHGDNLDGSGMHLPPEQLAERFVDVGSRPIVYCGSGVTACHAMLAMSLTGTDDARLYPGSWSEWSADPARPIATSSVDQRGGMSP